MKHQEEKKESIKKRYFSSDEDEGVRAQVLYVLPTILLQLRTVYSASSEVEDAAVARPWKILAIRRSNCGHCGFPRIIREYKFFLKNISFFQIRRLACGTFFSIHRYLYNYLKYRIISF